MFDNLYFFVFLHSNIFKTIMKTKHIVIFILTCFFFCGCRERSTTKLLNRVDSYIYNYQTDSAKKLISLVDTNSLNDEEIAFYGLLDLEIKHRSCELTKSYSGIDNSIAYYERIENQYKLARCYKTKGVALLDEKKNKEGLLLLKKAEEKALNIKDADLLYYINSSLAYVNHASGNFNYALLYGKKTLSYAKETGHDEKIGHSYNIISSSFQRLGKLDSALLYIDKGLQYVRNINSKERNSILNNAAVIYGKAGNTTKAKELLKQSLAFQPNANAYGTLAQTYSEEGKDDSAALLWAKALKTDNFRQKISFMKSYARWQERNGKYEEASATAIKVAELKDSLARQQQAEAIKEIQDKYDRKVSENESQSWIIISFSVATMTLVVAMAMAWKYMRTWRREQKAKKEIAENRMMIADYTALIAKMKNYGREKSTEIKKLQEKLSALQEKQAEILYKGSTLYEDIQNGGTTAKWNKEMFSWFVEYYRTQNLPFVRQLEQEYKSLSNMNLTFLILYDMGYTDQDIRHIMSMEPGAMRTMKSRINGKKTD